MLLQDATYKRAAPGKKPGLLKPSAVWCNKQGITWVEGLAIPEEWGNE